MKHVKNELESADRTSNWNALLRCEDWLGRVLDVEGHALKLDDACCCVVSPQERLVTHGDLFRLEVATIVMETFLKHDQVQYVLYTHQLQTANESTPTNPPSPYGRGNHSTNT